MSSSHIPSDNRLYNSVDYWDKRYESCGQSESQSYDWLVGYSDVKHIIEKCVPKTGSVLMLGKTTDTESMTSYCCCFWLCSDPK